jgi:hypothetical protein
VRFVHAVWRTFSVGKARGVGRAREVGDTEWRTKRAGQRCACFAGGGPALNPCSRSRRQSRWEGLSRVARTKKQVGSVQGRAEERAKGSGVVSSNIHAKACKRYSQGGTAT